MKLITGGAYQGKAETALKLFGIRKEDIISGEDCEFEEVLTAKCIRDYHRLVSRLMDTGADPVEFTKRLCRENSSCILIMNEIGCGIVPMERKERVYRENVGRCGCIIAAESDEVVRVICGIAHFLKGEGK
ncbi:bifunctional adenosylcobinamide kinase/adenosylcobinamide-phosphate guanylyltransferase [Ruminococcus flavefaciens]|uniref:Adenosylcobinamide kinase n=1 Tax=Ruminococcus flavefaciens TaxID=1265 RepID=A0A1M7LWF1_RUMFL|nr:bifunctional adenosylcobinamide kinase/adenosylcobinamide-phosphate guanylyltransferase [Ruminococcus flavefaciens]SHM82134.1 adenosylcobinamide kinase /adenosylcobinamide-phosphate guanylyltransferase [Ruminococcus flavefaciens]